MSMPTDGSRLLLTVLISVWAFAVVFGVYVYVTASDAMEGQRNFVGWQAIAGIVGFAIFGVSRRWPKGGPMRRFGAIPIVLAGLLALGVLSVFIFVSGG